uniref:Uncharacterized protein n=1 Tax=Cacopsylla melanoneura TaxID=428564 RepID=A0A8D8T7A8_9HEMI
MSPVAFFVPFNILSDILFCEKSNFTTINTTTCRSENMGSSLIRGKTTFLTKKLFDLFSTLGLTVQRLWARLSIMASMSPNIFKITSYEILGSFLFLNLHSRKIDIVYKINFRALSCCMNNDIVCIVL